MDRYLYVWISVLAALVAASVVVNELYRSRKLKRRRYERWMDGLAAATVLWSVVVCTLVALQVLYDVVFG